MKPVDLEELADVVGEYADLSGMDVRENMVLGEDIPMDSRQMLRLLSRLEGRYRFRFVPQDLLTTRTLGDLLRLVRGRARR